jgi:hypothetical protein
VAIERLSIREFAKIVGVSDVAVGKAIKAGKIVDAIDWSNPKRPKIDPVRAAEEWGRNIDPSTERTDKVNETIAIVPKGEKPKKQKPSELYEKHQDNIPAGNSIAEIKRKTAEVKLRLAAVELKQKQGQLVDKDMVYRSLFAAGQEMRTALQSIPDRCIDNILASTDRNEAHTILYTEITNALERLVEIYKRGLNDVQDEE